LIKFLTYQEVRTKRPAESYLSYRSQVVQDLSILFRFYIFVILHELQEEAKGLFASSLQITSNHSCDKLNRRQPSIKRAPI